MTGKDRIRQEESLTPAQERAAALIAQGLTDGEAAKAVKVSRQTLNDWKNHHEGFQAAVKKALGEIWDDSRDNLRAIIAKALKVVNGHLEADSLPAALGILKIAAAFERLPETANAEPKKTIIEVVWQKDLPPSKWQEEELERRRREGKPIG